MQDDEYAEYAAYLKKQTYDDLLSISYAINQETQARRYEMVLAEIAERDKRGEKSDEKSEEKTDAKTLARFLAIAVGLCYAILGMVAVLTGTLYTRHGHPIIATEKPVAFKVFVGLYFALAAMLFFLGFKNKK